MLWKQSNFVGRDVEARDGTVGSISDLLFEQGNWTVRWVVIDTGSWLPGRLVILPPAVLSEFGVEDPVVRVDLPRERIENAPGLAHDEPVSRQMERTIYAHYALDPYWPPATHPSAAPVPPPGVPHAPAPGGDPNLRSAEEVAGYYVEATDGDIGHIEEFVVDDEDWRIRHAIVDTRNWLPGRMVVIPVDWLSDVRWAAQSVRVGVTRERIESSPEYDPTRPPDRTYEERLYSHYGETPYWF